MAKNDKQEEKQQIASDVSKEKVDERKGKLEKSSGLSGELDGAAREALAVQKGHNRAAGADMNEDYLALTEEEVKEKGYLGYSPVGPGENDGTGQNSRLGTLGDFGEE